MSTRLERAEKLNRAHKLHPSKHREIVITERNRQIFALKKRLRVADISARLYRETLEQIAYVRHPSYKMLARATLAFVETQTTAAYVASKGEQK